MTDKLIQIAFNANELHFLSFVFVEVFGGGSTAAIQRVLGDRVTAARELQPTVSAQAESQGGYLELTEPQWRVMYESLNAVIYGLGPTELHTCTGYALHEAFNLNLRICAGVSGVFLGRSEWTDSTT